MISVTDMVAAFRAMLGWPYASPGSNSRSGIDCSGAFVYAYRQHGQSIYHGSNRIIRRYCRDVRAVADASDLEVGMAIFKSQSDLSRMKDEYKPGGRYYDPGLPLDYYHIGLVTSVAPLQIIHATPPQVTTGTRLSGWSVAGYLNAVQYDGGEAIAKPDETEADAQADASPLSAAYVVAQQGGSVNLRAQPEPAAPVVARVPLGRRVQAYAVQDGWRRVRYGATEGYMMAEFVVTGCSS